MLKKSYVFLKKKLTKLMEPTKNNWIPKLNLKLSWQLLKLKSLQNRVIWEHIKKNWPKHLPKK